MNQLKLSDLTVENILSTGVSVKMQITDSISKNLTNSDLESTVFFVRATCLHTRFVLHIVVLLIAFKCGIFMFARC